MPPSEPIETQKNQTRPSLKTLISYLKNERKDLAWTLVIFIVFACYGLTNRDWGHVRTLYNSLDVKIPLLPNTVFIYHLWSPTLFLVLAYLFVQNRKNYRAMITSTAVGAVLAFSTFIFFTTFIPRPEILGNDLASQIIRLTYAIDPPFSGFPSYHVLTTCIFTYFFLKTSKNGLHKILLTLWSALICATTVLTKQHVVMDIAGGLLYTLPSLIIGVNLERYVSKRRQA